VLALLAALPATRSVELSLLEFLDDGGTYRDLLTDMRDELGWQERATASRPKVSIGVPLTNPMPARAVWIDDEVDNFLYGSGQNSFGAKGERNPNDVAAGRGMVRDAFDPTHERPWAYRAALMRLGYIKKVPWLLDQEDARLAAGSSPAEQLTEMNSVSCEAETSHVRLDKGGSKWAPKAIIALFLILVSDSRHSRGLETSPLFTLYSPVSRLCLTLTHLSSR
jgi:hypothetical protein